MSISDVAVQRVLYYCVIPFVIEIVIYILLKNFGTSLKQRLLCAFWNYAMVRYHTDLESVKRIHFSSMSYQRSANLFLRNKGLLRILEIGPGPGANFEFFPPNSKLIVVEPNAYFEPLFYERQKSSTVKMEKFLLTSAEDMAGVEDNSVDIVVSTLVLSSVANVQQALKEIHRVLAPGGKFYYWEHVHDVPGTWLHTIQNLVTLTLSDFLFGCHLNRNIDQMIAEDERFTDVDQQRFNIPLRNKPILWRLVRVHVMGIATK